MVSLKTVKLMKINHHRLCTSLLFFWMSQFYFLVRTQARLNYVPPYQLQYSLNYPMMGLFAMYSHIENTRRYGFNLVILGVHSSANDSS